MLFRRNSRKTEAQLERQISDVLMKAELDHVPGADAVAFNVAGDLCQEAGDFDRAVSYYGLAIDAFLRAERWDAAAAICRKILRLSPMAVRTRCTLAWLAIGKGMAGEAQAQIRAYAAAAMRAHREALAVAQLKRMGEAAPNPGVREAVAELLLDLEADRAADYLFGTVYRDRNAGRRLPDASETLWATVRRAALLGPSELVVR
ncbi:MAG: hypothetical protein ACT4O1_16200 [Gemmatimonadota bacterium]